MPRRFALLVALLAFSAAPARAQDQSVAPVHAIAMHGEPKYPADFKHFDYVDPDAPKGGEVHLSAFGTFDNLNPYILKGDAADGLGSVFETLLSSSDDEAFTEYGLIAQSVELPTDRSWVIFNLRPEARFQDGTPITADDVIFSLDILKTKGHPFYRSYYKNVEKVEKLGPLKVKFTFAGGPNRELPLIVGQMPVLPKHYWEGKEFDKTTLTPPLGSGPYKIDGLDAGRSITYRRDPNYWGKDLPVRVGQNNFDVIRYDYYRDPTVALEAFKAGAFDFRSENISKMWATGYDIPQVKDGRIIRELIPNEIPTGMQGFVFNLRRDLFKDAKVREALNYAFDFDWSNKNLFYGQYTRTRSYFSNSELEAKGLPDAAETAVLAPFRGKIPDEVFTKEYQPPPSPTPEAFRDNLRHALDLLRQAGWDIVDQKLVNKATGRPFEFEILLDQPEFERIAEPFARNLERLGITAKIRTVDSAQYQNRMDSFDFDMAVAVFGQSLSPGNEQRDFWGSASADTPGGRNLIGIKDPVIDALVDQVIAAPDREGLITRVHALDRVLQWGFYVIPHWHITAFRIAYWNMFGHPKVAPKYALGFDGWWVDAEKAKALTRLGRAATN